jgi:hypothetical protein
MTEECHLVGYNPVEVHQGIDEVLLSCSVLRYRIVLFSVYVLFSVRRVFYLVHMMPCYIFQLKLHVIQTNVFVSIYA